MRRARIATLAVAAVTAVVLAACADEPEQAEPEASDDSAAQLEPEVPELEAVEVEDGRVQDMGVIVPIPEGWEVDAQAFEQGIIVTGPADAPETAAILAATGIQDNPMLGFQGMGFDDALEAMRGIGEQAEVAVDEGIEFAGAEQAWMLLFQGVMGQQQMPETDQLIVLAVDADDQLALFNYSSTSGEYDTAIEALVLEEGGFDPDSEPVQPEIPEIEPTP